MVFKLVRILTTTTLLLFSLTATAGPSTTGGGCFVLDSNMASWVLVDFIHHQVPLPRLVGRADRLSPSNPGPFPVSIKELKSWKHAHALVKAQVNHSDSLPRYLLEALEFLPMQYAIDTELDATICADPGAVPAATYRMNEGLTLGLRMFNLLPFEQQVAFWVHEAARFLQIDFNRDAILSNAWVESATVKIMTKDSSSLLTLGQEIAQIREQSQLNQRLQLLRLSTCADLKNHMSASHFASTQCQNPRALTADDWAKEVLHLDGLVSESAVQLQTQNSRHHNSEAYLVWKALFEVRTLLMKQLRVERIYLGIVYSQAPAGYRFHRLNKVDLKFDPFAHAANFPICPPGTEIHSVMDRELVRSTYIETEKFLHAIMSDIDLPAFQLGRKLNEQETRIYAQAKTQLQTCHKRFLSLGFKISELNRALFRNFN